MRTPEQIQAANDLFVSLTPRERKVAVAKEVLAMLDAEKFVPEKGAYIMAHDDADTVEELVEYAAPCTVCAIGAATLAACKLFNDADGLPADPDTRPGHLKDYLSRTFSLHEVCQIENAFERHSWYGDGSDPWACNGVPEQDRLRARDLLAPDITDADAMRLIFTHIAERGEFLP